MAVPPVLSSTYSITLIISRRRVRTIKKGGFIIRTVFSNLNLIKIIIGRFFHFTRLKRAGLFRNRIGFNAKGLLLQRIVCPMVALRLDSHGKGDAAIQATIAHRTRVVAVSQQG